MGVFRNENAAARPFRATQQQGKCSSTWEKKMVRFIKSPKLSVFVIAGETWRRPAFRLDGVNSNEKLLIDDKTNPNNVNYFHHKRMTTTGSTSVLFCISSVWDTV